MSARRARYALILLAGCAAAPLGAAGPATRASPIQTARLADAHALAPDFAARAELALRDAEREAEPAAHAERARRAELLTRAAVVEAERVALARSLARDEERLAQAVTKRAAAERAASVTQTDRQLAAAGEAAHAEAAWAYAALARGEADSPSARERVSNVLQAHAQGLLAAALALGEHPPEADAASLQLTAASHAAPAARIAASEEALRNAARALGAARARLGVGRAAQREDLLEAASERGFMARVTPEGAVLEVQGAFQHGRPLPTTEAQRRLRLLRDRLPSFPLGSLTITCGSGDRGLAASRARYVVDALSDGVDRARFASIPDPSAPPNGVRVVLTAYGESTPGPTPSP